MSKEVDVLIVGAGPVGLMMAAQCLRYGISFRIVEKRAEPSEESRALAIHTRTLEHLHYLGLAKSFARKGLPIRQGTFYLEGKKRTNVRMDLVDSPYNFVLSLDQSDTERLLEKHLSKKGTRVERLKELVSFRQSKNGVTSSIRSRRGKVESVKSRFLLACDGAHSTVRHKLKLSFKGSKYPMTLALADLYVNWGKKNVKGIQAFFSSKGIAAFIPLRHRGRYRFLTTVPKDTEECSLELLQDLCDARTLKGIKLSRPVWMSIFRIHRRIVPSFRRKNVFLLGDAAHIHSPVGGQGMNIGMHETGNLAWKLRLFLEGLAGDSLLDSFNDERYPVARDILKGTDFATKVIFSKNPVLSKLKMAGFYLINSFAVLKKHLNIALSEIELDVEGSDLVFENWHGSGGVKSGKRMPDVKVGSKRLFDLLRPGKHLLIVLTKFTESIGTSKFAHLYSQKVVDTSRSSKEVKELMEVLGIRKEGVYVVRPDGYVGFRSNRLDWHGVEEYFARLTEK